MYLPGLAFSSAISSCAFFAGTLALTTITIGVEPMTAIGVMSANLVHLANASYRVGKRLNFDEKTLSFPGEKEATALLTRKYRAPYIVPEKV